MPRINKLELECDYCGHSETFNPAEPTSFKKVQRWNCVINALAPTNQQEDGSLWFDSFSCISRWALRERDRSLTSEKAEKELAELPSEVTGQTVNS